SDTRRPTMLTPSCLRCFTVDLQRISLRCVVIVILGLIIVVAVAIVGVAGVLGNGGSAHALTHGFSVLGYHVTGSTGTLFLYGIVVGAVAVAGLGLLLGRARPHSPPRRPGRTGVH